MADDHLAFTGILKAIGFSILVSFVYAIFLQDWVDFYFGWMYDYVAGLLGVVLFLVSLGVIVYVEYQTEQAREKGENVHIQFHQVGHEKRDVKPSDKSEMETLVAPSIITTIIANVLVAIIVILLAIYIFLTPAFWFFCSMAEGQSCGVEVVFWPIGFF